jgi:hypothetical protein
MHPPTTTHRVSATLRQATIAWAIFPETQATMPLTTRIAAHGPRTPLRGKLFAGTNDLDRPDQIMSPTAVTIRGVLSPSPSWRVNSPFVPIFQSSWPSGFERIPEDISALTMQEVLECRLGRAHTVRRVGARRAFSPNMKGQWLGSSSGSSTKICQSTCPPVRCPVSGSGRMRCG